MYQCDVTAAEAADAMVGVQLSCVAVVACLVAMEKESIVSSVLMRHRMRAASPV